MSEEEERQTAALSYLFFPLALPVLLDTGSEPRSAWARAHARHAFCFGLLACCLLAGIALIPLVLVVSIGLDVQSILLLYPISFVVDLVAVGVVLWYGIRAARGAARGEVSRY